MGRTSLLTLSSLQLSAVRTRQTRRRQSETRESNANPARRRHMQLAQAVCATRANRVRNEARGRDHAQSCLAKIAVIVAPRARARDWHANCFRAAHVKTGTIQLRAFFYRSVGVRRERACCMRE